MTADPFDGPGKAQGPGVIERDHYGRYKLPHPETGKSMAWTRATTWADTIAERFALNQWGLRMAIKGISMRPDLLALTAATPLEGKENKAKLQKIADQAKEAAGAKEKANLGTALHGFTESIDQGGDPDSIPEPWRADVKAYAAAMREGGYAVVPGMVERVCVIPQLGVAGTFDRILGRIPAGGPEHDLEGPFVIGDLKSGNVEYAWGEIAVQLALYANATHVWDPVTGTYSPMPEMDRETAIVMHLPVGEKRCTLYEVNIEAGWGAAQFCGTVRAWRKRKDLASPVYEHVTGAANVNWGQRLRDAADREELSSIWREATARGEWSEALEKLGRQQLVRFPAG